MKTVNIGCERLCFLMIAVVLFFILATDIYRVEEADATRRSMRSWCLSLMILMLALFLSPEQQPVAQPRFASEPPLVCQQQVMAWQQPRMPLAGCSRAAARAAYHQALAQSMARRLGCSII